MRNYRITYMNELTGEVFEVHEFARERFTKREWDIVTTCLFYHAAESIDYRQISAKVEADGKVAFWAFCNTAENNYPDWSLRAYIFVMNAKAGQLELVRNMEIAA